MIKIFKPFFFQTGPSHLLHRSSIQRNWILSVGSTLILTGVAACTPPKDYSNSVTKSGNCTYQFVEDYNNVVESTASLKTLAAADPRDEAKMEEASRLLRADCGVFKQAHTDITCKATNLTTNKETTIEANPLTTNCDQNQKAYSDRKSNKTFPAQIFDGKEKSEYLDAIE